MPLGLTHNEPHASLDFLMFAEEPKTVDFALKADLNISLDLPADEVAGYSALVDWDFDGTPALTVQQSSVQDVDYNQVC